VSRSAGAPAGMSDRAAAEAERIVLVHGIFRTARDMRFLETFLRARGYATLAPTLPTEFCSLDECCERLRAAVAGWNPGNARVHFIGHSMGGLIVRCLVSGGGPLQVGRCILIAAPNAGSGLADLACSLLGPFAGIFRGLQSLRRKDVRANAALNQGGGRYGVIAGTSGRMLTGLLLPGISDGRVELESAAAVAAQDFLVIPCRHTGIHHRRETAEAVLRYIRTGSFGSARGL